MPRQPPKYIMDVLSRASQEHGIPFSVLKSFADIESGFRPGARTGSYKGLFQLSNKEFKRGGGKGSIFNPEANTNAFVNVLKKNMQQFENVMGRAPSGWEAYLVHQQGLGGGPAHLRNPDRPAWQNMAGTSEGKRKGTRWAKKAIWGNIPAAQKKKFGNVNNVTSGQFTEMWKARYERSAGGQEFDPSAAGTPPLPGRGEMADLPERGMRVAGRETDMEVPPQRSAALAIDMPEKSDAGQVPRREYRERAKFQYQAPEYESANDIGAGGPPPPTRNPQDAPEPVRSAVLPGSPENARQGSRMTASAKFGGGGGSFDPAAEMAFGAPFGELYGRKDMGSTLLKDVLPSSGGKGVSTIGPMPAQPPMFRDFFKSMFGFGGFG